MKFLDQPKPDVGSRIEFVQDMNFRLDIQGKQENMYNFDHWMIKKGPYFFKIFTKVFSILNPPLENLTTSIAIEEIQILNWFYSRPLCSKSIIMVVNQTDVSLTCI